MKRSFIRELLISLLLASTQAAAQDSELVARAEAGAVAAQTELGYIYAVGEGVAQDFTTALQWFKRAADLGYADAQYNYGNMYANGFGVDQDYAQALQWYQRAAAQDHMRAQYNLGFMYDNAQGVAQDYNEAAKWYLAAAQQGHEAAQNNLGVMYKYGYGLEQSYPNALQWLKLSAESGYPIGQFNYGAMFVNGTGVERDFAEAAKWYQLAADSGNVSAQFGLADMYIAGEGVAQDYEKAGSLYLSAAKQGNPEAQYNIGEMFAAGYGVEQNFILAYLWSDISAQTATVFHRGRATRTKRQLALLYVTEPEGEGMLWLGVEDVAREEGLNKARAVFRLFSRKLKALGYDKLVPEELVRDGAKAEEITQAIEQSCGQAQRQWKRLSAKYAGQPKWRKIIDEQANDAVRSYRKSS